MKATMALFAALSLSLGTAARAQSGSTDLMPLERVSRPELVELVPGTIATLQLDGGVKVDFVNVGDGYVAVAERAPANRPFLTTAMIREWDATPLEIFTALAPGRSIPMALIHDQNSRSSSGLPPRVLNAPTPPLKLNDPGIDDFNCDSFGTNFHDSWLDVFNGVTQYAKASAGHNLSGWYSFYPDGYYNPDNSISPGYNGVTYIGACNGDDATPLTVEVHQRIKYTTPPTVMFFWAVITQIDLGYNQKYTFHSSLPASFRGRVKSPADETVDHFSIGVAYTKARWFQSPL